MVSWLSLPRVAVFGVGGAGVACAGGVSTLRPPWCDAGGLWGQDEDPLMIKKIRMGFDLSSIQASRWASRGAPPVFGAHGALR